MFTALGITIGVLLYTVFCVIVAFFIGWYSDEDV